MEVRFTEEQEAQITRIAANAGIDKESFVKDAALRALGEEHGFRLMVREGISQADRGELIEDDEVRVWLEKQEQPD